MSERTPHTQYLDSPAIAYEVNVTEEQRRTYDATEPKPGEAITDVSARLRQTLEDSRSGKYGEDRQKLLSEELRILGLPEDADADTFWPAHHQLIGELDTLGNEVLADSRTVVVDSLSKRLADSTRTRDDIAALLLERTGSRWSEVNDSLRHPEAPLRSALATHNGALGSITLQLPGVISALGEKQMDKNELRENAAQIYRHEMMHAAFAVWYDPDKLFTGVASNGIELIDEQKHGEWLNEGTIEKYRRDNFGNDSFGFSYEAAVTVLDAADAVDPDFEDARLKAAVFNEGRGEMIGRLETLFGPLAYEQIGGLIADVKQVSDLHGFKESVIGMLSDENKAPALAAMEKAIADVEEKVARSKAG